MLMNNIFNKTSYLLKLYSQRGTRALIPTRDKPARFVITCMISKV